MGIPPRSVLTYECVSVFDKAGRVEYWFHCIEDSTRVFFVDETDDEATLNHDGIFTTLHQAQAVIQEH